MEISVRLFVFVAAILLGVFAPTQRHFGLLRAACIAVDVLLPFLTSGEASKIKMEEAKSSLPAGSGVPPPEAGQRQHSPHTAAPPTQAALASTAGPKIEVERQHSDHAPRPSSPPAGELTPPGGDNAPSSAQDAAILSDLALHGTHMTKKERKETEEILKRKYGAGDRQ